MAITNPEAVAFTNEAVRPLAERVHAIKNDIDSAMARWHGGLGAVFVGDLAGVVEDGREDEGVSRLTGNDVTLLIGRLEAIQQLLDAAGVPGIVSKPRVRFLSA